MSVGFVFPGQGSQYVGMARVAFESSPSFAAFVGQASEAVGLDITRLCLEGPEEALKRTAIQQPVVASVSIGLFGLLKERGCLPSVVAGHSLGEYVALVAAGALTPLAAVRLVAERGKLMEAAVEHTPGAMAAVLGMDEAALAAICADAGSAGVVQIANLNCPGQIVISGEADAVAAAMAAAKAHGAKRCIPLPVSGPFHSRLMAPVGESLVDLAQRAGVTDPQLPIYMNRTARPATTAPEIVRLLGEQVSGAVRWEETVRAMAEAGVTRFVEVGPGKVLAGLVRKTLGAAAVSIANVEDLGDIDELCSELA